jgi:hypothetical protein
MSIAIAGAGESAAYLTPQPQAERLDREQEREKPREVRESSAAHGQGAEPREDPVVRAAEDQKDFRRSVLALEYTGRGAIVDTLV